MTKQEVLQALRAWEKDPHGPHCDALCDAAEYLGLPEGEYSFEYLAEAVDCQTDS
jgi:hypothetical protein